MKKEELNDIDAEGKDVLYLDIDRMVNEGMGAGIIVEHNGNKNIDEVTIDVTKEEEPPNK